jgi:predicted amidohydrolase
MHENAAETIPGPSTEEIAKLTKELDVYVLLGMPEKDTEGRYIAVAVIGPEGVIGKYRKIAVAPAPIWTEQGCGFKPGTELPIFETRYGPIGIQICAAFWIIPEYTRILCHKGARIIFNCTGSNDGPGKIERMPQVTSTRGNESFVYAVSANLVGKERTISYYGHICIAGAYFPRGTHTFSEGGESEEIVSATLSFDNLHYWWAAADPKKLINLELVASEYRKLADANS